MADEQALMQTFVYEALQGRTALRVLDAGCGSDSYVSVPEGAHRVGVDISEEQLRKNTFVHEKVLGDIQTCQMPASSFDMIVCWWVLEHLPEPSRALRNFLGWLKQDGIIVLAVPNVLSVKGLMTKYTPHWFHVWIYHTLYDYPMAGTPGFPPFRTWLRFSISPAAIARFARENGLSVAYLHLYESEGIKRILEQHRILNACVSLPRRLVKLLTFGKVDVGLTECIVVLKKADVARGSHTNVSQEPTNYHGLG